MRDLCVDISWWLQLGVLSAILPYGSLLELLLWLSFSCESLPERVAEVPMDLCTLLASLCNPPQTMLWLSNGCAPKLKCCQEEAVEVDIGNGC
jgi:hypothetical protein